MTAVGITMVALLAGVLAGLARGGSWHHVAKHRLAGWPLLAVGIALQVATGSLGHWATVSLLGSYVLLIAFVAMNLAKTGMPVVLAGLVLNATVIAVNDGMPVRRSAVASAGRAGSLASVHLTGKHHLATRSDHLLALADIIPVKPFHEVVAVGDLAIAAGLAIVLASLLGPPRPVYVPLHMRKSRTPTRLTRASESG